MAPSSSNASLATDSYSPESCCPNKRLALAHFRSLNINTSTALLSSSPTHVTVHLQAIPKMAANEVNDIVIRLLATADKIGGREREEILHHVGRLSRAATRERNTAIDEMQKLRNKVVQQSAELKRIENTSSQGHPAPQSRSVSQGNPAFQGRAALPSTQAPQASQPPLASPPDACHTNEQLADTLLQAGGFARFTETRLQAIGPSSGPGLDYGSDYGRLPRPDGLSQPMRKATPATTDPRLAGRKQQSAPVGGPAVSAATPRDTMIEEQPGFGLFNQARFLALQAGPSDTASLDDSEEGSSLSSRPAPPKYSVTAANAEPVVPRGKKRDDSIGEASSITQNLNQAARNMEQIIKNGQALDRLRGLIRGMLEYSSAGHKRRASDGDVTAASSVKRQLIAIGPPESSDVTHQGVARTQMVVSGTANVGSVHHPQSAVHYNIPQAGRPTCTHCFQSGVTNCDGQAHCNQGGSHKCYYVLCDPLTCQGLACVRIHSSQYNLQTRESGQPRRLVIGDSSSLPNGQWDRHGHGKAVIAMGGAFTMKRKQLVSQLAALPKPAQGIYRMPPSGRVKSHGLNGPKGKDGAGQQQAVAAMGSPIVQKNGALTTWNDNKLAGLPTTAQGIYPMPQSHVQSAGSVNQGHHLFNVTEAVRDAVSGKSSALMYDASQSSSLFDPRSIKVETSEGWKA
jgi:hypothetical protein